MFLGIDCSTQSFKILIIDESKRVVKETSIVYDDDLPHYKTSDGVIRYTGQFDGLEHIASPTLMFVEAFEKALDKLRAEGFDLGSVKAISGSGQQHGSVWWKTGAKQTLDSLRSQDTPTSQRLVELFKGSFSSELSPIWMDASTSIECRELQEGVGSGQVLAEITGSRAFERFTGPQIKHLYKHLPDVYANTERISLISSFLPSLLIGDYAPIDLSDGSGMNILDIRARDWDPRLLDLVALNLKEKLGRPVPSDSIVGQVGSYWCRRFGFGADCRVCAFSGDNPCSLVGLGLSQPGDVGISLGTSDVLFAVTRDPKPSADQGSILIHPSDPANFMMMLVYKNGAMTRKRVRDAVHKDSNKSWTGFNQSIRNTPVGSGGQVGFYLHELEITPNTTNSGLVKFNQEDQVVYESLDNSSNRIGLTETDCRSIIESQALSYKYHAQALGLSDHIKSIVVTGGGSVNTEILQILADVFEVDVRQSTTANTAASGAAIRALDAYLKETTGSGKGSANSNDSSLVVKCNSQNFHVYREMFRRFGRLETKACEILNRLP